MNVTLKGTVPVYYWLEIPDEFTPLAEEEPQNNELLDTLDSWLDENADRLNLPQNMELDWIMTKDGKFVTIY
jgi:hypothetical protein